MTATGRSTEIKRISELTDMVLGYEKCEGESPSIVKIGSEKQWNIKRKV